MDWISKGSAFRNIPLAAVTINDIPRVLLLIFLLSRQTRLKKTKDPRFKHDEVSDFLHGNGFAYLGKWIRQA